VKIVTDLLEERLRLYAGLEERGQTVGGFLVSTEKNGVIPGLVYFNLVGIAPEEKGDR